MLLLQLTGFKECNSMDSQGNGRLVEDRSDQVMMWRAALVMHCALEVA